MEANIELLERILEQHPEIYTPSQASRMRRSLKALRDEVEEMKQHERELWEQQPGGIAAPMPHEAKPRGPAKP